MSLAGQSGYSPSGAVDLFERLAHAYRIILQEHREPRTRENRFTLHMKLHKGEFVK